MAMMMMKRRRNPTAIMIVSSMKDEEKGKSMEDTKDVMDMLKLATYESASKSGLNIKDMDAFVECIKMVHQYLHKYEEAMGEYPEGDTMDDTSSEQSSSDSEY